MAFSYGDWVRPETAGSINCAPCCGSSIKVRWPSPLVVAWNPRLIELRLVIELLRKAILSANY